MINIDDLQPEMEPMLSHDLGCRGITVPGTKLNDPVHPLYRDQFFLQIPLSLFLN